MIPAETPGGSGMLCDNDPALVGQLTRTPESFIDDHVDDDDDDDNDNDDDDMFIFSPSQNSGRTSPSGICPLQRTEQNFFCHISLFTKLISQAAYFGKTFPAGFGNNFLHYN